jgi:ribosomal protein S18 acetylase RimI-like enzyme
MKELVMVNIRPYMETDLNLVVTLWYRSWSEAFPTLHHPQPIEQWKSRFQNNYSKPETTWVATIQEQVVGFLVLNDRIIEQIFVAVEMQSKGVGTVLLNHAKTLHPEGLRLTTLQKNELARHFYEKHGFVAGTIGVNSVNGQPNIEYCWMTCSQVSR